MPISEGSYKWIRGQQGRDFIKQRNTSVISSLAEKQDREKTTVYFLESKGSHKKPNKQTKKPHSMNQTKKENSEEKPKASVLWLKCIKKSSEWDEKNISYAKQSGKANPVK